jgi:flagellar basal-body rod modification protein FlgD
MDIAALNIPSQGASSQASSQLTADFDTFLTLLTTQLQNQDPLEPLDTERFTEQLVQFAGVEQSIQTNQHLEALIALQTSSANETALAMVGRIASVDNDIATLSADQPARWTYTLPQDAVDASIQIFNDTGDLVAAFNAATSEGPHDIDWGGATSAGGRAAPGDYRIEATAIDRDGAPIEIAIAARGRVDAVSFASGVPEIEIAGRRFALNLVSRVDAEF